MWFREFLEHGAGSAAHGMLGHGLSAFVVSAAKIGFVVGPVAISSGALQFTSLETDLLVDALVFEAPAAPIESLSRELWGEDPIMPAEDAGGAGTSAEAQRAGSGPAVVVAALPPVAAFAHAVSSFRARPATAPAARIAPAAPRERARKAPAAEKARTETAAPGAASLGGPAVGASRAPLAGTPPAAPPPLIAASAPPAPSVPEPAVAEAAPAREPAGPEPPASTEEPAEDPETEGKDACGKEPAYPPEAACGALVFRAHSLEELEGYSKDFGFNGKVYAHLVVDFDFSGRTLRIASPCDLTIAQGVTFNMEGDLCLEAAREVHVRSSAAITVSGEFASVSSGTSFTLGSGATLDAASLRLSAPLGVELISDSVTTVEGAASIVSAGAGPGGHFTLGQGAAIEADSLSVAAEGSAWLRRGTVTAVDGVFEMSAPTCTLSPLATISAGEFAGPCFTQP